MVSSVIGGKVCDWTYKPLGNGVYAFDVGDIPLATVHNMGSRWSVVVFGDCAMRSAGGFATRHDAAKFATESSFRVRNP